VTPPNQPNTEAMTGGKRDAAIKTAAKARHSALVHHGDRLGSWEEWHFKDDDLFEAKVLIDAYEQAFPQTPSPPSEAATFDSSWADARPLCHECNREIPSGEAIVLPASPNGIEDDDEFVGVLLHRRCPAAQSQGGPG
jgi:hypothetical protein